MAIPTLSGSYIDETYIRLVQVSGSEFADGLGNPISFGAGSLSGGINGYIPVWSGSTSLSNSIISQTNNLLNVSGSLNVSDGITGSLEGTASWAFNSITASYIDPLFISSSAAYYGFGNGISIDTGSFATTGSNTFTDNQSISGGYGLYLNNTNIDSYLTNIFPQQIELNRTTSGSNDLYRMFVQATGIQMDIQPGGAYAQDGAQLSAGVVSVYSFINGTAAALFGNATLGLSSGSNNYLEVGIDKISIQVSESVDITGTKSLIEFQNYDTYTDGRVTFKTLINAESGIDVTGSVKISNELSIDETLTKFTKYTNIGLGIANNITLFSIPTGSYTSAFGKYTIYSGSNSRAGELMTSRNGTNVNSTDVATNDIGNTSVVRLTSQVSESYYQILASFPATGTWDIKMMATYI